jgi:hypothetical protein
VKKLLFAGCVAALVAAAPAAARSIDTTHSLRAAGTVLSDKTEGTQGVFRITMRMGPGHKLTYIDRAMGVTFRAKTIAFVNYTSKTEAQKSGWAVKIKGMGWMNGKLVPFTAVAVDHPAPLGTDIFRISINHGASFGGKLQTGGVKILQI